MKQIVLFASIVWATTSVGQTLKKGIYKGRQVPFTICYLTYSDSTIEVEYFFQKSAQIFGHISAKRLAIYLDSSSKKSAFKSTDDSISVFTRSNHFLVKRRGLGKIKVYKSVDSQQRIASLRNQSRLFSFSHRLFDELKHQPNFDEDLFWKNVHSHELAKYINLDSSSFNKKLEYAREDIKRNMQ